MDRLPVGGKECSNLIVPSHIYPIAATIIRNTILSTKDLSSNVPFTCQEMAHSWDPSCFRSACYLFFGCFKEAISIYGSLYAVTGLLRGRPLKYYLTKLPHETFRSTTFLAANCFFFLAFFCIGRKLTGRISYWGLLLSNIPACFLSILIERKQRRGLLALYLANLATETGFNMIVDRNWIKSVNNGQVLLFSIVSSVYVFLFQTKLLDGSLSNIIKAFLGSEEANDDKNSLNRQSRVVKYYGFVTEILGNLTNLATKSKSTHRNKLYVLMKKFEERIEGFFNRLSIQKSLKHRLCQHRYTCWMYSLKGFISRFIGGFLLQAGIKIASSLFQIFKKPSILKKILTSSANVELGLFFGCFNLIYRLSSCALKWLTNKNSKFHALIAGYLAGWSMMFYKSSSITLYLTFKLFEILWMLGVKNKKLPLFKNFDILLYTLSTAFILWVGVFEPHNIRQQYWKFLVRVSSTKFAAVNRHILDVFGTKASTINRTYRPIYDSTKSLLNSHLKN